MSTAAEPQKAEDAADPENAEGAVESFYASIIDRAELGKAMAVRGVDQEIGLLRAQLLDHGKKLPADFALMLKSIELIVRATQARYRMSAQSREDLAGAITGSLRELTKQLTGPKETDDV